MEKQHKIPTKEKKTENRNSYNNSYDIAAEIMLLLDDYFCGNFTHDCDCILMKLVDGKVFRLSVSEVV